MSNLKHLPIFVLTVFALEGKSQSSFINFSTGPLIQMSAGSHPTDVAVADFDRDGRPDLAITEQWRDTLAIFKQRPGGTFAGVYNVIYFPEYISPQVTAGIAMVSFISRQSNIYKLGK